MKKKGLALAVAAGIMLALAGCSGQTVQENQNGGVQSGQTASGITGETARTLALQQAGVAEEDVLASGVKEDYDDGVSCYEVVFNTKDTDYEYKIDRTNGTLLESNKETFDFSWGTPQGAGITKEEAQNIIMEQVPGAKADNIRMKAEVENGRIVYEGEVIYENAKYEYEMDAQTGKLLEWSQGDLF